jgi:restriction system protein
LTKNTDRVDTKYLRQFPTFLDFQNTSRNNKKSEQDETTIIENNDLNHEKNLDKAYERIRKSLAHELLNKVVTSPMLFLSDL